MEEQHTTGSRSFSEQDVEEIISKALRQTRPEVTILTRKEREKWYRDQYWQFVGALIGITAIIVAGIIFYFEREIKSITVTVLTNTSLASIADTVAEDVQLLYKGSPIPGLFLVQVKLENNGNVEIRSPDYEEPITLVLSPGSTVVDATVVEAEPSGVGLSMNWEGNQVTLSRTLLNQGDRVVIQILVVHPSDQQLALHARGRIAGVRDIPIQSALQRERVDLDTIDSPVLIILVFGIVLLAVVLALLFFRGERAETRP